MPADELTNFSGGVHTRVRPLWSQGDGYQAMFYMEDADNFELSDDGILKFKGWADDLDSAISGTPKITGDFEYKSGSSLVRVVCAGTKIYTVSGGVATEIKSSMTADAYYQAAMWNDGTNNILLLCNGVDTPVRYNGTNCQSITFTDPQTIWNSAKPFAVAVFRDRVFWMTTSTIYTPQPGSHNNFDNSQNTVDAFQVDPGYGGNLTGIKALTNDILIIYKENCIRRLSGSAPFASGGEQFQIHPVTDEVGCVAPRSIVSTGSEHYFLGRNGLRQLKPVDSYGDIEHLQPTYPVQDKINLLNWSSHSAISNACATYLQSENQIYLSVPNGSSSTNNKIFVYDIITKGISPRSSINASTISVYNRQLVHGDYAGQVYTHGGVNSANGSSIAAYCESKWMCHSGLGTYKRYKRVTIYVEGDGPTDLGIQFKVLKRGESVATSETESIGGSSDAWDVGLWDVARWASGTQTVFELKNIGRGKALKLRFANSSATQRPKIRQIFIEYDVFSTVRG